MSEAHRDEAGARLGMWLFLVTEFVLFGGLFLVYSYLRHVYPGDFHHGGARMNVALGVANTVLMQEYAVYSVITPEGCASILWKDSTQAPAAAEAMQITAPHMLEHGLIDGIVPEPLGGAQGDWDQAAAILKDAVLKALDALAGLGPDALVDHRYDKFARMGSYLS